MHQIRRQEDAMDVHTHPHNDGHPGADASGTRSIARAVEPPLLSPRALEDRRLIHRNDSTRLQADAFRDLRTRLLALGGDRNFVTLVVPVTHGCGEFFAKPFRRLPEVVSALSRSLGKGRIGEMRPIAHAGAVFLELDLAFEIGCHLVEFANDSLQIFDLPRLFLDLAALQEHGRLT